MYSLWAHTGLLQFGRTACVSAVLACSPIDFGALSEKTCNLIEINRTVGKTQENCGYTKQSRVNPPKSTRSRVYILTAVIRAIAEDKGKRGGEKGDKSPVTELTLGWEAYHSHICSPSSCRLLCS